MRTARQAVPGADALRTIRAIGALVGLAVLCCTCRTARMTSGCSTPSKPARELSLRVMTFNIRYGTADDRENEWSLRKELVFDVIGSSKPDVACLQEVLDWQLEETLRALPAYGHVGVGRDDGERKGEFAPILYAADRFTVVEQGTFWLSATPEKPGSMTWGNRLPRICTWVRLLDRSTGRNVHIYNLHLDHESQSSREQAVVLLAQRIRHQSNTGPLIVAGDFNANEDNPAIRFLTGEGTAFTATASRLPSSPKLVDAFRVAHPDAKDVGTYHGFRGTTSGPKVDYIFVPATTCVRSAEIRHNRKDERYPSDHFPVVADVVFGSR